jgi:hypothetical protein
LINHSTAIATFYRTTNNSRLERWNYYCGGVYGNIKEMQIVTYTIPLSAGAIPIKKRLAIADRPDAKSLVTTSTNPPLPYSQNFLQSIHRYEKIEKHRWMTTLFCSSRIIIREDGAKITKRKKYVQRGGGMGNRRVS